MFAGELVVNLFDTVAKKRYFFVVSNSQRKFYLMQPVGDKMVVRSEQPLPLQPSFNVMQVTANADNTKLLLNSDRYLRLYQVSYPRTPYD